MSIKEAAAPECAISVPWALVLAWTHGPGLRLVARNIPRSLDGPYATVYTRCEQPRAIAAISTVALTSTAQRMASRCDAVTHVQKL